MNKEQAAILFEILLTLPISLAFILGFIWYSTSVNAKNTFKSAVVNATLTAKTRGGLENVSSPTAYPDYSALKAQMRWQISAGDADSYHDTLKIFDNLDCGDTLLSLLDEAGEQRYLSYAYAITYAYQAMKASAGRSVKFPCDPNNLDPDNRGCMRCYFETPDSALLAASTPLEEHFPSPAPDFSLWHCGNANPSDNRPIPADHFTLVCEYRPNHYLFNHIMLLLGYVISDPSLGVLTQRSSL